LLSEHLRVHWDSNSQGESSLGSVRVHSLTLSFTPELPLLAHNLASPYLGHEPKAKVATFFVIMNVLLTNGFFSWRFTSLQNFWKPQGLEV